MLNLKLNYPSLPVEAELFEAWTRTFSTEAKKDLLHPPYRPLNSEAEQTVRQWLHVPDGPYNIVSLPSANNGVYCILSWFKGKTRSIACEPYTFPGFKMTASLLDYQLAPIESDNDGILPDSLRRCLLEKDCKLVYLQPTIHNPTTRVMPLTRREAIVAVMREFEDASIIEDDAYRFLHPDPPPAFVELAPDKTLHVYSLSKAFNPMLRSAYLVHPAGTLQGIENLVQLTSSGTSRLFIAFGLHLMRSGQLLSTMQEKQRVGRQWYGECQNILQGLSFDMFPGSFHLWLQVPKPADLSRQLYEQGIDVPQGADFTVSGTDQYVRVALGTVWDRPQLPDALNILADAVRGQLKSSNITC